MLTIYDYIVIGFYFVFIMALGVVFKKFNKGSKDYFAGGQRMCWWLLGGSLFISNFSCWTFTGASGIARKYGILILYIYAMDVIGYIVGYIWFASRLRQMRLITAMDGIRRRFGKVNEQFFTWFNVIRAPLGGGVWLMGLAVILATVFDMPKNPIIIITGLAVLIMAMMGGNWAVAASDFIQLLLLMTISVVTAVMCIVKLGGIGPFFDQLPPDTFQIFYPLGEIRYDWLFLAAGLFGGILLRNNMMTAAKYVSARDSKHAKKAALLPLVGYTILPILWFVPAWASHTLVPDLMQNTTFAHPEEASYIATAMVVLPQGLLGLLVVGLFAATMSSMDTAFNKNAGFIVCNFYRDILRPKAKDKELYLAGQIATALSGALVITVALLLANVGKISIFDSYLYFGVLIGPGAAVVFLLGMFIKRTPPWIAWVTTLSSMLIASFLFLGLRADWMAEILRPQIAGTFLAPAYEYVLKNPFWMGGLIIFPCSVIIYLTSMKFYRPEKYPEYVEEVDKLFVDMNNPIDFDKEIGEENDNSAQQAKTLGGLSLVYGGFILLLVFIPNPWSGRLAIALCSLIMLLVGGFLYFVGTKAKKVDVKEEDNDGQPEVGLSEIEPEPKV